VRLRILAAALALGAAYPAIAQVPLRSDRAASAMPATYSDPLCPLKGNYYKTTDAIIHLREALTTRKVDKRALELDKGREALLQAIIKNKQDKSSTAWYVLAQIYLYQGDVAGADSALRRTEAISPKCAAPIEALRHMLWAPLVNAGVEFTRSGASDSALALFQQAAAIYPEKPQAWLSAGVVLANTSRTDSAIVYFERAAAAAERQNLPEERNQATYNLAAMLQRADRHQEAAAALEKYLGWQPKDQNARRALAVSYRAAGRIDAARELEGRAGSSGATPDDLLRMAINFYEERQWAEAAKAFERALGASPYSRDAVFGLAASYQALEDGPRLVQTARKLLEIEPLNPDALRLLGAGYQQTEQSDSALETAKQLVGLVTAVAVEGFTTSSDSAALTATATGRAAETVTGKPLPPAATPLVFEFIDSLGNVVASAEAVIPPLKRDETSPVAVQAKGKGVVGWRYRRTADHPASSSVTAAGGATRP